MDSSVAVVSGLILDWVHGSLDGSGANIDSCGFRWLSMTPMNESMLKYCISTFYLYNHTQYCDSRYNAMHWTAG